MAALYSAKNLLEMSPDRDFPSQTTVRMRYCILSSQRSGSTLLARMLAETRQAGDPLEYFNLRLLQLGRAQTGNQALTPFEFMRLMELRRTSPSGVFGMKIHYEQMLRAFQSETPNQKIIDFLRNYQYLLWIRRRGRLRQAISHAIATQTNSWSSEEPQTPNGGSTSCYDCIRSLQAISFQDLGWEQLIRTAHLKVHVVWYEDLISEYEKTCRLALRHLNLQNTISTIPSPPIERQSGPSNDRLYAELITYFGVSPDLTTSQITRAGVAPPAQPS
jgi:trehalose 2-sulfotransferase